MVRLASLNVCLQPPGLVNVGLWGNDRKPERIALVVDFCVGHQIDIVLLQEVWDVGWSSRTIHQVKNRFAEQGFVHAIYVPVKRWSLTNTGMMVLSTQPLGHPHEYVFQHTGGWQSLVSNGALYTQITIPGWGELHLAVTHLHAGPADTAWRNDGPTCRRIQRAQVQELRQFLKTHIADSAPTLVVGDFNTETLGDDSTIHPPNVLDVEEVVTELGLGDSLLKPLQPPYTYPSTYPFPITGGYLVNPAFENQPICVDHAFTNVHGVQATVHAPYWKDEWLSDHAALILTLP